MEFKKGVINIATYNYEEVVKKFKPGDEIWACAYEFDCNKESKKYIQKPVKGVFTDSWCSDDSDEPVFFTTIGKNGYPSRSKKVGIRARVYADTYEECVELYNSLVKSKINYFEERIEEVKKELILEDEDESRS